MLGRATVTLGIGPQSSYVFFTVFDLLFRCASPLALCKRLFFLPVLRPLKACCVTVSSSVVGYK